MPANKKKAVNMRGHVADFIKARHNEKRAREAELNRLDNEVGKDEVEKRHEANNSCCPAEADLVEQATKDDGIDDSSSEPPAAVTLKKNGTRAILGTSKSHELMPMRTPSVRKI